MSEDLEIEYQIEDIDGLVATDEFAAHEEVAQEEEVVEEVVVNNDSQDIYEDLDDDDSDDRAEPDEEPTDDKVGDDQVYQWSAFTGLRVKSFTSDELANFRKPFELGWRREVVLRGTVTSSGKKIGDVYYFSPDKKTKLRSYVEMGLFLKRSQSALEPENFTFARQPIFRPPLEIVRHAMQRGQTTGQTTPSLDFKEETPAPVSRSARTSTASESEEQFAMSIAEGRAKRKRVAPTRFEDENYEESPFKKKPLKMGPNGGQTSPVVATTSLKAQQTPQQKQQLSLQEKRRQLQHQLYQQVHEKTLKQQQEQEKQNPPPERPPEPPNGEVKAEEPPEEDSKEIAVTKVEADGKQVVLPLNARKSISQTKPKPEEEPSTDKSDQEAQSQAEQPGAPCSMHCPGRRGMLPNLMCSRCFCLYHLDCVPGGVFLEEPRVFVCPNCLTPEDTQKEPKVNGHAEEETVAAPPVVVQQKPRSTFAPILPKPPQLAQTMFHQQMYQKSRQKLQSAVQPLAVFNKSAAMNVRLPVGTHLYRVATTPNGHSMIVKDKSIKPKLKRKPLPAYKPAPIAPIGPIKLTPQQIQRQLREILHPAAHRRGYQQYMDRRKTAVQCLVSPYLCLNQVLSYLTVTDLVRLRQVSRVWNQLSSQPFLWRHVKLKGVAINDWQYLAKNVIECFQSVGVDFEGVKAPNQDACEFWRNFQTIVDYLKSVRVLRFGAIPTFVLEEIANAAVTDNPYNSFAALEELSVRHCFEEESDVKECRLAFLADFHALTALTRLDVNCKNGFVADINTIELLTQVFKQMPALQTLVLTSLKDFTSEQFVFLTSLTQLRHLEIGSCRNWFDETSIGAFQYLSGLTQLRQLRLVDITLTDCSQSLTRTLEALSQLEALTIDNLKIEASGMEVLEQLCAVLKSLPMRTFSVSSDDSQTNKRVCDLLKRLDNCQKLLWRVGALVEDSGECFVAFKRDLEESEDDSDDADVKYMDLTFLNEVIQSELSHAIVEIAPQ